MAQIVTITNPLTGQPAQVDQLEHTAQEIDDGIGFESTDYPGCYYRTVDGVVEWFNPPMELGKEYRTTERWHGKPVYVLTKPSKTLGAAGSEVYIEGLPGDIEDVIDYRLKIKSSGGSVAMNNYFNSNGSAQCVSSVQVTTDHYAWAVIQCINDCTSLTATGTFKYIKTTD